MNTTDTEDRLSNRIKVGSVYDTNVPGLCIRVTKLCPPGEPHGFGFLGTVAERPAGPFPRGTTTQEVGSVLAFQHDGVARYTRGWFGSADEIRLVLPEEAEKSKFEVGKTYPTNKPGLSFRIEAHDAGEWAPWAYLGKLVADPKVASTLPEDAHNAMRMQGGVCFEATGEAQNTDHWFGSPDRTENIWLLPEPVKFEVGKRYRTTIPEVEAEVVEQGLDGNPVRVRIHAPKGSPTDRWTTCPSYFADAKTGEVWGLVEGGVLLKLTEEPAKPELPVFSIGQTYRTNKPGVSIKIEKCMSTAQTESLGWKYKGVVAGELPAGSSRSLDGAGAVGIYFQPDGTALGTKSWFPESSSEHLKILPELALKPKFEVGKRYQTTIPGVVGLVTEIEDRPHKSDGKLYASGVFEAPGIPHWDRFEFGFFALTGSVPGILHEGGEIKLLSDAVVPAEVKLRIGRVYRDRNNGLCYLPTAEVGGRFQCLLFRPGATSATLSFAPLLGNGRSEDGSVELVEFDDYKAEPQLRLPFEAGKWYRDSRGLVIECLKPERKTDGDGTVLLFIPKQADRLGDYVAYADKNGVLVASKKRIVAGPFDTREEAAA